jgi:hypothetical protein
VAKVDPLNATEEAFWRALVRVVLSLPRRLDSDLVRSVGITANQYTTLMCLSEAFCCRAGCCWDALSARRR